MNSILLFIATTLAIGLSGCGGDSDSASVPILSSNVSGTVAIGEGVPAHITFIGAQGNTLSGVSDSNGAYSANLTGLTAPYMIRAVLDADGSTLYSFIAPNALTANITPLTTYVLDQAAVTSGTAGGAGQLFTQFDSASIPTSLNDNIQAQIVTLNALIATVLDANDVGTFDHFNDAFDANHNGYDAVLDALDIEIYEDDIIIRTGGQTLDTLNYDINATDINVTGNVYDISNENNISNATIAMTDSAGNIFSTTSDVNGTFILEVNTMRVYDINISATGYTTQFIPNVPAFALTETSIGQVAMYPQSYAVNTNLTGTVIDGRTSSTGIENATLKFRTGYGQRISTPVETINTDTSGEYNLASLVSGSYTLEISKDEYYTVFLNVDVHGATQTLDFSLLGDLSSNSNSDTDTSSFATVTLNWDADPEDLDSHLTGPAVDGGDTRFHLYYSHDVIESPTYTNTSNSVCSNGEIASLDRDRTDISSGLLPETVTLCNVVDGGLYKYYVHHYDGFTTISEGNAKVVVATHTGVSRTFIAPAVGNTGTNDIWHVFNIDSDGNIYPINQIIGNGEDDDTTLFQAPSRNNVDKFSADSNLLVDLPAK